MASQGLRKLVIIALLLSETLRVCLAARFALTGKAEGRREELF